MPWSPEIKANGKKAKLRSPGECQGTLNSSRSSNIFILDCQVGPGWTKLRFRQGTSVGSRTLAELPDLLEGSGAPWVAGGASGVGARGKQATALSMRPDPIVLECPCRKYRKALHPDFKGDRGIKEAFYFPFSALCVFQILYTECALLS